MENKNKTYVLQGLDSFSKEDLNRYWSGYDPLNDKPKLLGVGLSCSNRCNVRCIYCYAGDKSPEPDELTLEEQIDVLSQAKALGAKTAIMCGDAEPLMDKNLLPIVEHCHTLDMTCVVVTNATVIGDDRLAKAVHGKNGRDVAQFLYDNGASLIVKMDSVDPEKYEQIIGVKDSYKKFIKAVNCFKDIGFCEGIPRNNLTVTRVSFSGVVMKHTIDEVPAMKKFADEMGAQFVCKLPTLVGRAVQNKDFMFPVEEYEEKRKILAKYTAKRETLMVDTPRCMAWHYGPVISIKGEVRECYTMACPEDKRIGNIRETSLENLMRRRNQIYDITLEDFCPVKTRINQEFVAAGKRKLWEVLPENSREEQKHF